MVNKACSIPQKFAVPSAKIFVRKNVQCRPTKPPHLCARKVLRTMPQTLRNDIANDNWKTEL